MVAKENNNMSTILPWGLSHLTVDQCALGFQQVMLINSSTFLHKPHTQWETARYWVERPFLLTFTMAGSSVMLSEASLEFMRNNDGLKVDESLARTLVWSVVCFGWPGVKPYFFLPLTPLGWFLIQSVILKLWIRVGQLGLAVAVQQKRSNRKEIQGWHKMKCETCGWK